MSLPSGLQLRRANDDDHDRIMRDWLMSYRDRTRCELDVFFREHRKVVNRLLTHVQILHRVGSEVHGWICGWPGIVHYVYVPTELRRNGLAREMVLAVAGVAGEHTHRRMSGLTGFSGWSYNPYRIGMVD